MFRQSRCGWVVLLFGVRDAAKGQRHKHPASVCSMVAARRASGTLAPCPRQTTPRLPVWMGRVTT